ncbi:MAG: shikimate kinase [Flavobacteriaceae bacterium]|nr:shikimate kinase [Flavobacteriaceae bacterium]
MEIVLLGYMGSGKSTIGKYLAKKLDLQFVDLDEYIEAKENQSISNIFKEKGEIYFRFQEATYLKEFITINFNYVLALGGGTPCYADNTNSLKNSKAISFYLKATIPTLLQRLENEKENRPLIVDLKPEELTEFIGKHLFERAPFYEQATSKISIDNKNPEEICLDIITQLEQIS